MSWAVGLHLFSHTFTAFFRPALNVSSSLSPTLYMQQFAYVDLFSSQWCLKPIWHHSMIYVISNIPLFFLSLMFDSPFLYVIADSWTLDLWTKFSLLVYALGR